MDIEDFRRIALSFEGVEEKSHMGAPDFRVGGRIFATLASQKQGFGNLMLSPEQQAAFIEELPEVFLPVSGGWGKSGATHIRLAAANEDVLAGALRTAWKRRREQNAKSSRLKTRAKR
jgi:hypothetical protein